MDVDEPIVATALEALISEASSTPDPRAKITAKRHYEKDLSSSSSKNLRTSIEGSVNSRLGPVSGSSISLSDSIRNNRYSADNAGPFDVHIQRISNPKSPLHPTFVGRVICELDVKEILEIKKIGYSKASVFFKTREAANALVEDKRLSLKDLEAFIPPFRTSRKGIIRDVPQDFSDHEILSNITSPIKVVAVNRMNRRTTTNFHTDSQEDSSSSSVTYVPSLSVSLTFEGQKIPNHVFMFHVRYPVSPYVARVSRCNRCFRFGHIQTNCKSQPCCAHCGDKGHTYSKENCQRAQNPPRCVNCQGEHRADSTLCPELSIQKEIRKYAAYRNVSLLDAREIFKGNRSPPSYSSSSEDFPNLPSTHPKTHASHSNSYSLLPPLSTSISSSLSYANASKHFSSNLTTQPTPLSNLTRNLKFKSVSLPQLKQSNSLPSPYGSQKQPRSNVSFSTPSTPSFPLPASPLNSITHSNSKHDKVPTSNPPTLHETLLLLVPLLSQLSPLLSSINWSDAIPAVIQFLQAFAANPAPASSHSSVND